MTCQSCGTENPDAARFCMGCGSARAHLTTAAAMLREMGMTFWLPEAEVELAATAP